MSILEKLIPQHPQRKKVYERFFNLLKDKTHCTEEDLQKMVLNMLSTSVMIKLGRIKGNKMVNMQLTNQKLFDRGVKMIMDELHTNDEQKAANLLTKYGSVKKSIEMAEKE